MVVPPKESVATFVFITFEDMLRKFTREHRTWQKCLPWRWWGQRRRWKGCAVHTQPRPEKCNFDVKLLKKALQKTTPNHPKNRPFLPEFHLLFSQISQKPLGGWVNRFGTLGDIPKKSFFWAGFPILHCGKVVLCHLGRLRSSWFFLWNLVAEHDKCWACFHLYTV